MSTLIANLDEQVAKSPKFKEETVAEHFRHSNLKWWQSICTRNSYQEQEGAISEWLSPLMIDKILELGPGFGRITRILKRSCTGSLRLVEINNSACKHLTVEFPDISLVSADVITYPWDSEKYDLIAAVEILVHIPDIVTLIRRIHAALVAGGSTIVSVTPLGWYKRHVRRQLVIDRGIDQQEFEAFVKTLFEIDKFHKSSNGQQLTYMLRRQ